MRTDRLRHGGLAALLASLLIAAVPAGASLFGGGEPELLPVEEAFPVNAERLTPDRVVVTWNTAGGYYLYRERFDFRSEAAGVTIARAELPPGKIKDDPYFGRMEVYYGPVSASIWLADAPSGEFTLTVDYQGCADAGLCYPPQTTQLAIGAASATSAPVASGGGGAIAAAGWLDAGVAELDGVLQGGNPLLVIGVFLVAGLLLAFTACLYPMIPILSGLIAGDRRRGHPGRALLLSFVYVEATAATYALAGVVAGLSGSAVQASLQSPWVLGAFAGLFVLMALSMFGLFEVRMPATVQTRIAALSARQRGGTVLGVAAMGMLSTLIVGACSGPALIAALAFIARTGDATLGGLALFALANGMGLPLLLIGTAAGKWLPTAGGWMEGVRRVFGVAFLAVALWLLERFLPAPAVLALWGLLLIGVGLHLGIAVAATAWPTLRRTAAVAITVWGIAALVGAAGGGRDLLQPLTPLLAERSEAVAAEGSGAAVAGFRTVKTIDDLRAELARAETTGRPVIVDVYADWCVYCVQLDEEVFSNPRVRAALADAVLLRADVTANDARDKALMEALGVFLPPAVLFIDDSGEELRGQRVVGFVDAEEFLRRAGRIGLEADDA